MNNRKKNKLVSCCNGFIDHTCSYVIERTFRAIISCVDFNHSLIYRVESDISNDNEVFAVIVEEDIKRHLSKVCNNED